MLEKFIEAISSKGIEIILDKFVKQMMENMEPNFDSLEERLHSIEGKVERLLASHLKAGLTFLRMGNLENARDEFVRAEATDPYAAAAKLWLSAILFREGHSDLAVKKYKSALLLNPFVESYRPSNNDEYNVTLGDAKPPRPSATWSLLLTETLVKKQLPKPTLLKILFKGFMATQIQKFYYTGWSAVCKLSCSGGHPVVSWRLGSNFLDKRDYKEILSVFDLDNGKCLWAKFLKKEELCFATPLFVVLKLKESLGGYELFDLQTGKPKVKLGTEYYQTLFCPNEPYLSSVEQFVKSNVTMTDASTVYERSCDYSRKDTWVINHVEIPFQETCKCIVPFTENLFELIVTNAWEHMHFMGGQHMLPECGLGCESRLVAYKRELN